MDSTRGRFKNLEVFAQFYWSFERILRSLPTTEVKALVDDCTTLRREGGGWYAMRQIAPLVKELAMKEVAYRAGRKAESMGKPANG